MKRLFCLLLTAVLVLSLLPVAGGTKGGVQVGDSFTYTPEEHWGADDGIWSWQWALADSTDFSDMIFTTVEGQGEVYAADWTLYPYCAARKGGINVHPNAKADAARVFTAPASGWVTVTATVARQNEFTTPATSTPTSFRILLEETTVYPTTGDYRILTSATEEVLTASVFVKAGERLRFVVGAMDNQTSDAVNLQTTVTYETVEENVGEVCRVGESFIYEKTSATFGTADPHWSWEWALAGKTSFSPMTYQFVEKVGRELYASDWATHPYNYVDSLGVKLHPAETADTAKTFTVPFTGTVKLDTEVSRYYALADVSNSAANGTSLRILVNNTQVYPLYSSYLVLESKTPENFSVSLPVTKGDKIRIVIGGMGQVTSDAVKMYNTVTYTSLEAPVLCVSDKETFSATETQWANNDMGNWSFEYRDSNDTFGNMTYQYVEKYSKYMYASDWNAHAYNYVDSLGVKLHPAKARDVVKTYTVPHDGRVEMTIKIARYNEYVAEGSKNPTSLRVYKNNEQIWPTNGSQKEITSATAVTIRVHTDVRVGDKIRCVVGSMGNTTNDAVSMYNTVTYRAVGSRELAAFMDQYNQRIDVIDVQGDNLRTAETAWSWKPTTALGFTDLATFNSPTDAKIRYNSSLKKYVVAVCSSRGFMGVVDMATGKKIWQVSLVSDSSNPHAIEYLPNGNVAVAASIGGWLRVYTASQGSTSTKYTEVALQGAHGVLWDPTHNVLWCLGTYDIKAFRIGGTAAAPTLTEVTKYHATLTEDIKSGHDLSPVHGNPNRLWISSRSVLQYDIPTASFVRDYEGSEVIDRNTVKGVSNFPDSHTIVHVFPNETYLVHDSDRVFVTLPKDGVFYGRTHSHGTGAYYKVRSWIASYNTTHQVHRPVTVPATEPACTTDGQTEGSRCSYCNAVLVAQNPVPALGHSYDYKNAGETHNATCTRCNDTFAEAHSYTEGTCICGDAEVKEPALYEGFKIYHTLNLASGISLTYAVPKANLADFDMETVYMECNMETYAENVATGSKTITLLPTDAGNYYYFTLSDLTAVRMNDRVTAVLYGTKNGQPYYSATDFYSIADYAYGQLNAEGGEPLLKTLCADLLRYGAAVQAFKGYRTDAYADSAMTEEHRAWLSNLESVIFGNVNQSLSDLEDPTVAWVGKTLSLDSRVSIKYVVNLNDFSGNYDELRLHLRYADLEGEIKTAVVTQLEDYLPSKGWYAFTFDGLLAAELRSPVSAQVYAGDIPVSVTVQYSADTYGNHQTGSLGHLCKALFAYSDSARAFFTK